MKRRITTTTTTMTGVEPYECETLTEKLRRMTEQKEPIKAEVEIVYTEKKDGVLPGYDIRTDRFEVAREAIEKMQRAADVSKTLKGEDVQSVTAKMENVDMEKSEKIGQ